MSQAATAHAGMPARERILPETARAEPAAPAGAPRDNPVHALQAMAQCAIEEQSRAAHRWSPRAALATIAAASIFLWTVLGIMVF